jgi:hypothetical protein
MSEQAPQSEDTPTVDTPQGTGTEDQAAAELGGALQGGPSMGHPRGAGKVPARAAGADWSKRSSPTMPTRRQAFEALGLELADETEDDTRTRTRRTQLAKRLEALEAQIQQRDQQAQQAAADRSDRAARRAAARVADGLDESDREWIVNTAVAMPPTADGMPDIKAAFEKFTAWETERQKKWAKTKRTHAFSPVGEAGTQQPDLGTTEGKTASHPRPHGGRGAVARAAGVSFTHAPKEQKHGSDSHGSPPAPAGGMDPEEAVKQFEAGNGPLARIRKVKSTMIGKQAQVPIHKGRNLGGYTSVGAAGGNLNTAGNQQVDQATYTLVYHWLSVALDASALMQAGGSNQQSIVEGKVLEIENGIENIKHQSVRQLMTNGDSIVAACASGGASTTVSLVASPSGTAYGYDAIVRGWLGVGSVVDIGTTADTDALVTGTTVSAIAESASAPTITIGSSITTVAGTHFVYIANPNSTTAANPEINGLRNLINTSGAVGGLNPSTAGQEFWQAASRDTATTVFSLDLALSCSAASCRSRGSRRPTCGPASSSRRTSTACCRTRSASPATRPPRRGRCRRRSGTA